MSKFRFRPKQDIAVVGMAARVPGASDYDELWAALTAGESFVAPLSQERFDTDIFYRSDPHTYDEQRSGLHNAALGEIDQFDAAFFHITPREARAMDPQQRIVLEESWHCIEDSGIGLAELQQRQTSVFVGATGNDYALLACQQGADTDPYAPLGNFSCMLANRVSHAFGFSAHSMSIDTACSSSLVALDLACAQLRADESDYSLVGGVCLTNHPWRFVSFSQAHMMSPDGQCRAFDAEANGFVQGEGVGVLLLERLGDALDRGHRILGVIRGSAVNHGGSVKNVTAPNPSAQQDVIETAYRRAGLAPATLGYLEAHGTGTSLGDPIEVESLTRALRGIDPKLGSQVCGIGSLKTNFGHLSSAAGVVGVIKVLLMMRARELVQTLHLSEENPLIGFGQTPFFPVREPMAWQPLGGQDQLVAGVSGFGFGGVNAHVVLSSHPQRNEQDDPASTPEGLPFLLSAHTEQSLADLVDRWQHFVTTPAAAGLDPAGVARSLLVGRQMLEHRRAGFLAPDADLARALAELQGPQRQVEGGVHLLLGPLVDGPARALPKTLAAGPAARSLAAERGGRSLAPEQEALAAGHELAGLLVRALGEVESVRTGTDQGLVALALAGSVSLADALRASAEPQTRDEIRVGAPRFALCASDGSRWLSPTTIASGYLPELVAACHAEAAQDELPLATIKQLEAHQATYRRLLRDWLRAYDEQFGQQAAEQRGSIAESELVDWFAADPDRARLLRLMHVAAETRIRRKWQLRQQDAASATAELAALVDGGHLGAGLALGLLADPADQDLLAAGEAGLTGLGERPVDPELMPMLAGQQRDLGSLNQVLAALAQLAPAAEASHPIAVADDAAEPIVALAAASELPAALVELWLAGCDIAWAELYELDQEPAALPGTQFDRQRYWLPTPQPAPRPSNRSASPMLGPDPSVREAAGGTQITVSTTISRDAFYVRDHVVGGVPILPGVAYLELALAAVSQATGRRANLVQEITWLRPMRFDQGIDRLRVEISLTAEAAGRFRFSVASFDADQSREHARGVVAADDDLAGGHSGERVDLVSLREQALFCFDHDRVYGEVFSEAIGFDYGPTFRLTRTAYGLGGSTLEELDTEAVLAATSREFIAHPSILDAALRSVNWLGSEADCTSLVMQVPFSASQVALLGDLNTARHAVARPAARAVDGARVRVHDLDILDQDGLLVAQVRGFTLRPLNLAADSDSPRLFGRTLTPIEAAPDDAETIEPPSANRAVVIAGAAVDPTVRDLARVLAATRLPAGADATAVEDWTWLTDADQGAGTRLDVVQCLPDREPGIDVSLDDLELLGQVYELFQAAATRGWSVRHTILCTDQTVAGALVASLEVFTRSVRFVYPEFALGVLQFTGPLDGWDAADAAAVAKLRAADAALTRVPFITIGPTGAQRWRFEEVAFAPDDENAPCVRAGRRYLVSGGSGDLALQLVQHYRGRVDAEFLLLGRRSLDDLSSERREQLAALGPQVSYHQCDVLDLPALESLLDRLAEDGAPIAGVFHLAGAVGAQPATRVGSADLAGTVGVKVVGAANLDAATAALPLDFFVLFSSLSALVGDSDGSGYALANAGLNAFALARQSLVAAGTRRGVTSSVMWPVWQQGALRPTGEQEIVLNQHFGLTELASDEACRMLDVIVDQGLTQSVVLKGDPRKYSRIVEGPTKLAAPGQPAAAATSVGTADGDQANARGQLMGWLTGLVSTESGIAAEQIGPGVPLADYGIDSIMIISLLEKMGTRFSDLPSTLFFECQTLDEVADYLVAHDPVTVDSFGRLAPQAAPVSALPSDPAPAQVTEPVAEVAPPDDQIAIIGYAGRYPRSADLDQFWAHLLAGDDCIEVVPKDRWDHDQYFSADPGQPGTVNTKWGGFLPDIAGFDAAFFGISQREGKVMDPQERLFLETVYHAFEHAGYPRERVRGSDTAVYVGVMNGLYQLLGAEELSVGNVVDARASYAAIANRISYVFDLHGPSLAVDTMCSSSLTAIHLACEQLRTGDSTLAVAGGVNVIAHPAKYVFLSEQHFGSTEGKCRAFGDGGDGYVPAEGVGAVILKPLAAAVADGDVVHAVIRATGLNHGGHTHGFTVPNPKAQADLISATLDRAGLGADELGYVEAHGTGTLLGDPIEVSGLVSAFAERGLQFGGRRVPIGSVKANIGHAESSAGVASLTKVLLQMKQRTIVGSIHADPVNPRLRLGQTPLRLALEPEGWDLSAHPAALISSFGAGGSNAHLVVSAPAEQPKSAPRANSADRSSAQLIVLSAITQETLDDQVQSLSDWLHRAVGEFTRPAGGQRSDEVTRTVQRVLGGLLHLEPGEITPDQTLFDLGLDTDDIIRLRTELEQTVQRPGALFAMDTTTVAALSQQLIELGQSQPVTDERPDAESAAAQADLLARIARTLQQCREPFEWRAAFVVNSLAELDQALHDHQQRIPRPGCFTGTCDRYRPAAQIPDSVLLDAAARDDWAAVAAAWVAGQDSDWAVLHDHDKRYADVPGYAFRRVPLWLDRRATTSIQAGPVTTPVAGPTSKLVFDTPGQTLRFSHVFRAGDRLSADHIIGGQPLVPGAGQIGVVRDCLTLLDTDLAVFSDVRFLAPIVVDTDVWVDIWITREPDGAQARIVSTATSGEPTVHSQMLLRPDQTSGAPSRFSSDDPNPAAARTLGHEEIYRSFTAEGIDYGTAFRSLAQVVRGDEAATALLGANDLSRTPELAFASALDAALQLPSVFVGPLADGSADSHVPAAIEYLRIEPGNAPVRTARIRRSGEHSFDVALFGDQDRLLAEIAGLRVAVLANPLAERTGGPAATPARATQAVGQADAEDELGAVVLAHLIGVVAAVLETPADQIHPSWTFTDLGVDSVNGFRIVDELNQHYGADIKSTVLFDYPTAEQLRDYLLDHDEVVATAQTLLPAAAPESQPEPVGAERSEDVEPTPHTSPSPAAGASAPEPIAIIGMSGRFPGASDVDEFWQLLLAGRSAIGEVPLDRWDATALHTTDPGDLSGSVSKWGGFMDGVDRFDAEFFNITGYEGRWMDPQQRLMLTEAWRALDDAGYAQHNPHRERTGVFVGCCPGDYQDLILGSGVPLEPQSFWGTSPAVTSARVAYSLDLGGPCASFDTACSSALTACYFACQSLWTGGCEMAVVGGVFLLLSPKFHLMAGHGGMLSPNGRCATFSADADGFVPSEAVGAVILKPLSKAQTDQDQILGVIRGIDIDQDGRTNGVTAPNPRAQAKLIGSVHERFGVDPSTVSYVETHGTGTPLGDAIEVGALTEAFTGHAAATRCGLGSVKTNIGHASAAAGVVGMIKLVQSLRHRTLPASLHLGEENPRIGFADTPFEVVSQVRRWDAEGPLRAGLSSFGFSGTNVHLVVEQAPVESRPDAAEDEPFAFPISARNTDLLRETLGRLVAHLQANPDCSPLDLSYTLSRRRLGPGSVQRVLHASSIDALIEGLRRALASPDLGAADQPTQDPGDQISDPRHAQARMLHLPPTVLAEQRLWFRAERGLPAGFAGLTIAAGTDAAVESSTPQQGAAHDHAAEPGRAPGADRTDDLLAALTELRDGTRSLEDMAGALKGIRNGR